MAEWYYIGHYGQLGPLTLEQISELVQDGVVGRETYVWRAGMDGWMRAAEVAEFQGRFAHAAPPAPPPSRPYSPPAPPPYLSPSPRGYPFSGAMPSEKSRVAAGVLQLVFPGAGRLYLGYVAYGVLLLVLSLVSCGVLHILSMIDGMVILTGGVRVDGFGRPLRD